MKIPSVKPTEVVEGGTTGGTRRSHPAFAVMKASRFNGGEGTMYGSPLRHSGGISVSVELSDEHISFSHSNYWPKHQVDGGPTIVEVRMSEAQWAAFISTLNVGSGVPVTLEYARTGPLERMPYIVETSFEQKRADDIRAKTEEQNAQMRAALARFDELLEGGTIKKSDLRELRQMLVQCGDHLASNTGFAARMLTEHQEKLVESAKAEVSAMVTRMAMQFPQLAGQGPQLLQIEGKNEPST